MERIRMIKNGRRYVLVQQGQMFNIYAELDVARTVPIDSRYGHQWDNATKEAFIDWLEDAGYTVTFVG